MNTALSRILRLWPETALFAVAAATRLPLLGSAQGEPDSARFVLAVWQWIRWGARPAPATFTYHYYPVLAPGYFAVVGTLGSLAHIRFADLGFFLNALSALAALATAPLLYRIGLHILPQRAALIAALLFILSPAIWWLGIEAHPDGLALLAFLIALVLLLQDRLLPATLALGAALLLRCDTVLLIPVMAAVYGLERTRSQRDWALFGAGVFAACTIFTVGRWQILGTVAEEQSFATIERFLGHASVLHQVLPIITAPGVAVCALALVGIARAARTRFLWLVLAALPGLGFWLCITGNNVRHAAEFWLPLLWVGCLGIWKWNRNLLVPAGIGCLALNWAVIPANSNTTVYPAANVFAAHRLLAQKENAVQATALRLWTMAEHSRSACFVGAAANPYLLDTMLLQPAVPRILTINPQWQRVNWPGGTILVGDAYSDREYLAARTVCPNALSLEYAPPDRHLWYWGSELNHSNWMRKAEAWAHRIDMRHAQATLRAPIAPGNADPQP